jgi:head-tail adaptor
MRSRTGQYDKRITLLVPVANSDSHIPGATVWAAFDVKPPRGREIQVNDMKAAEQTRWIKIRYLAGITSAWGVRYGTTDFELASPPIDYEMAHRELYLELKVST